MNTIRSIFKQISKAEWKIVGLFSIIAIILTSISLVPLLWSPNDLHWTGIRSLTPVDYNVYYSYIHQVKTGHWLIFDHLTTEAQPLGLLNIFWLGTGLLAKLFNLSPIVIFQLTRILLIPIFTILAYLFISYFIKEKFKRYWALFFTLFSSGLGVYISNIDEVTNTAGSMKFYFSRASDLWMTEGTIFNTLMNSSHMTAALILIIAIFLLLILAFDSLRYRYSIIAGCLSLLLFNFHPYQLPTIFFVPLLYAIMLAVFYKKNIWSLAKHYFLSCLITAPSILYHFYTMTDSFLGARAYQNQTVSSPLFFTLIGIGLPGILAVIGWWQKKNTIQSKDWFLFFWVIVILLTLYLPDWQFQRRAFLGLSLPLGILSAEGWFYLKEKFIPFKKLLTTPIIYGGLIIFLFVPTTFYNIIRDYRYFQTPNDYFYQSTDEQRALNWLNEQPTGVVLSSPFNCAYIVAKTEQITWLGHPHETLNFHAKKLTVEKMFNNEMAENELLSQWQTMNLKYLYWNKVDQESFPEFKPETKKYLKPVFSNSDVTIFEFVY